MKDRCPNCNERLEIKIEPQTGLGHLVCPKCSTHERWVGHGRRLGDRNEGLEVILNGLKLIEDKIDKILENQMNEAINSALNGRRKKDGERA
jgi:hypothetical protein